MKLGNVELDGFIWLNRYGNIQRAETLTALDGSMVYFPPVSDGSKEIDLEAVDDMGWLTKAQAEELSEMASAAGAVYLLESGGETVRVRFRHEDAPALVVRPVAAKSEYDDDSYFYGTIKLRSV
jgi:hypothetical protein